MPCNCDAMKRNAATAEAALCLYQRVPHDIFTSQCPSILHNMHFGLSQHAFGMSSEAATSTLPVWAVRAVMVDGPNMQSHTCALVTSQSVCGIERGMLWQ